MSTPGGTATAADIGVIVEGSYPYVHGGVASWLQQLMSRLPEFSFHLVVLVARTEDARTPRYEIPKNVTGMTLLPLQDGIRRPLFLPRANPDIRVLQQLILEPFDLEVLRQVLRKQSGLSLKKKKARMLYSRATWYTLEDFYLQNELHQFSFLDYFWQLRSLMLSFTNTLGTQIPRCRMYHSLSTGYAGLVMAAAHLKYPEIPCLLTEHGIYTRERAMEISMTQWPNQNLEEYAPNEAISFYANLWTRIFQDMATCCYQASTKILSLFERNNQIQMEQGAPKEIVSYIFNGINLQKFQGQPRTLQGKEKFLIGFLGRVVKIKDVKTFIRAAALIRQEFSQARFEIAGPGDEDPAYMKECQELSQTLGLEDCLVFSGKQDAREFFQRIDVMVLTSLSEGQPLVILEGYAMGVPCVATDVGACREIIEGNRDDQLGQSGFITRAIAPRQTADGVIRMLKNPALYAEFSRIAIKRATELYDEQDFLNRYREVYQNLLTQKAAS